MGVFHDTFIQSAVFLCLPSVFENVERILLDVTAVLVSRQEADGDYYSFKSLAKAYEPM